jgi:HEAT repeat protein
VTVDASDGHSDGHSDAHGDTGSDTGRRWENVLRAALAAQLSRLPLFAANSPPALDLWAAALLSTWTRQGRLLLLLEVGETGTGAWWRGPAQWLAGEGRASRVLLALADATAPYHLARWFVPYAIHRAPDSAGASLSPPTVRADLTSRDPDARLSALVQAVVGFAAPPTITYSHPHEPAPAAAQPQLVRSLRDMWHEVRAAAAIGLGLIGNTGALPALTMAMGDPQSGVRRAAVLAIGQIAAAPGAEASDDRGRATLAAALGAYYADVRATAAAVLGMLNAEDAPMLPSRASLVPSSHLPGLLADLLADPSDEVQRAAVAALQRVGAPALPELAVALASERVAVRAGAALALGCPGRAAALPLLLRARHDPAVDVRTAVAHALGCLAIAHAQPALGELAADAHAEVRAAAAGALSALGAAGAPPLAALLRDTDAAVRAAAVTGLVTLGGAAAPALLAVLAAPDPAVRWLAIHTLGAIGGGADPAAVHAALAAALDDPYSAVRWLAADTLGQLGLRGPALQRAREDRNPIVRAAAHAALTTPPSAAPAGGRQTGAGTRRTPLLPASPPG